MPLMDVVAVAARSVQFTVDNRLFTVVANAVPALPQLNPFTAPLIVLISAFSLFANSCPRLAQSTVSIRPFRPVAKPVPMFSQLMPVKNSFMVLTSVLMPSPKVWPISSQSMPSTSPLMIPVMPFTTSVILPPRLSQLIQSFAFSKALLMPPAMILPMPS